MADSRGKPVLNLRLSMPSGDAPPNQPRGESATAPMKRKSAETEHEDPPSSKQARTEDIQESDSSSTSGTDSQSSPENVPDTRMKIDESTRKIDTSTKIVSGKFSALKTAVKDAKNDLQSLLGEDQKQVAHILQLDEDYDRQREILDGIGAERSRYKELNEDLNNKIAGLRKQAEELVEILRE